jgi:hypothetical protein
LRGAHTLMYFTSWTHPFWWRPANCRAPYCLHPRVPVSDVCTCLLAGLWSVSPGLVCFKTEPNFAPVAEHAVPRQPCNVHCMVRTLRKQPAQPCSDGHSLPASRSCGAGCYHCCGCLCFSLRAACARRCERCCCGCRSRPPPYPCRRPCRPHFQSDACRSR